MMSIPATMMDGTELTRANLAAGLWLLPASLVVALVFVFMMKETFGAALERAATYAGSALTSQS